MTATKDFLIEIGTADIPAKNLIPLAEALATHLKNNLAKAELAHKNIDIFATPRRLGVLINDLITQQQNYRVERKGPAISAAFDANGNPTQACLGFARSCGVNVEQLQKQKSDKGEYLVFSYEQTGEATEKLLPEIVRNAITQLPISKPMRWGSQTTSFIRPVYWVLMLFGDSLIDTTILGLPTTKLTLGHRFHHPKPIKINHAADYEENLFSTGKVIANFTRRLENIRQQLTHAANKLGDVVIDEDLLNEVTGLVEWPVALLGKFEQRFLEVPAEALISAMKTHQKCFPVIDAEKKLLPYFITVSNIESKDPHQVIIGNERVIRARLSDAAFFYHSDLKHRLETHLEQLKTVVFQNKLGSLFAKANRISQLAAYIAKQINANNQQAARAGLLCKSDLLSAMVGEFPELQGIMGYYYALADGESQAVAVAIKEQYLPKFAGDVLPDTALGYAVAIADKIDTLVGIFGIDQAPTGERDPFALRRAALGVLRIIIEKRLTLDLKDLLTQAAQNYETPLANKNTVTQTLEFMMERLRAWYSDQGISADIFAAVLARYPTQPLDFHERIHAVQHFQKLPEAKSLAAANKRVSNILKKQDGVSIHSQVNPVLLESEAEKNLANSLEKKAKEVEQLYQQGKYTQAFTSLASLQKPVDDFFDNVLVMVEDEKLKNNRLALLTNLRNLFLQIADISLLQA